MPHFPEAPPFPIPLPRLTLHSSRSSRGRSPPGTPDGETKASPEPQGELPARSESQSSAPQGPTTAQDKATRDPGPDPLPTYTQGPTGRTGRRSPLDPTRGSHPAVTLGRELPDAVNELLQRRRHLGGWRRGRARYGRGGAGGCEGGGREGAARAGAAEGSGKEAPPRAPPPPANQRPLRESRDARRRASLPLSRESRSLSPPPVAVAGVTAAQPEAPPPRALRTREAILAREVVTQQGRRAGG